jgi:hypothetical protein
LTVRSESVPFLSTLKVYVPVFSLLNVYLGFAAGHKGEFNAVIWLCVFKEVKIMYRNGIRKIAKHAAAKAVTNV